MSDDPYAPPSASVARVEGPLTEQEQLRRDYLREEVRIRGLGKLMLALGTVVAVFTVRNLLLGSGEALIPLVGGVPVELVLFGAVAAIPTGFGLWALNRIAFTSVLLLCFYPGVVVLISAPSLPSLLLLLAGGLIAYGIGQRSVRVVFTQTYLQAVAETSHMTPRRDNLLINVLLLGTVGTVLAVVALKALR